MKNKQIEILFYKFQTRRKENLLTKAFRIIETSRRKLAQKTCKFGGGNL